MLYTSLGFYDVSTNMIPRKGRIHANITYKLTVKLVKYLMTLLVQSFLFSESNMLRTNVQT